MNEEKKESCCAHDHKGGCCGISKCLIKIVLALLIFGFGFLVGKSNVCPWQMMCPISQQK